jgi:sugar porter (SP) family MFS transporter
VAVGSFLAGPLADRVGRRYALMSTAALFVASAFGAAVSPSLGWLLAARAAAGIAMGISASAIGLYVAEVAPAAIRGRMLSFGTVAGLMGGLLVSAYGVVLSLGHTAHGWRLMFGVIALPAAIYGMALLPLPESPRWLAATGQLGAARRSLLRLVEVTREREAETDRQMALITATEPDATADHDDERRGWARLWGPIYRPPVLAGLTIVFLMEFSGSQMVGFYGPTILSDSGFGDQTFAFAVMLGLGAANLAMILVSATIIDRVGRKPLLITGLAVMSTFLVSFAVLYSVDHVSAWARWSEIGCLVGLDMTFWFSVGIVGWIWLGEIFPQELRGLSTSLLGGMSGVMTIVFTLTFPLLLDKLGLAVVTPIYAVFNIVGAIYLMRTLPETKGKSLEDIGDYWRHRAVPSDMRRDIGSTRVRFDRP